MDIVKAFLIDDKQNINGITTLHARPDYTNHGGCDKNTVYYPSHVSGRHDFIINMALDAGLFNNCEYVFVADGISDITKDVIFGLVETAKKEDADVVVPSSNTGRDVQRLDRVDEKIEYHAYLELDCFLIKADTLITVAGFEKKFCHVTSPELYLNTYYTMLAYYDMDFCIKLWQAGYSIALDRSKQITFYQKTSNVYEYKQLSGGKDALWYYRRFDADDVETCGEGKPNINKLLNEKRVEYFREPDINKGFELAPGKKLILIVIPQYLHFVKNNIKEDSFNNIYKIYELFFSKLEAQGYIVKIASEELLDMAAAIVFMRLSLDIFEVSYRVYEFACVDKYINLINKRGYQYKTILLASSEPSFIQPDYYDTSKHASFMYCMTQDMSIIDNKKYFYCPAILDFDLEIINEFNVDYSEKKLCTFACGGYFRELKDKKVLYSDRLSLVEFFNSVHSDQFEFYGYNWPQDKYKCYKGVCDNRFEVFSKYKFVICYVNYIDSVYKFFDCRLFDAFIAGSVPIYFGSPDIKDIVPEDTFIDPRDFKDYNELYDFITTMDEKIYNGYLERINKFLNSDIAQKYSLDNAVQCLKNVVQRIND